MRLRGWLLKPFIHESPLPTHHAHPRASASSHLLELQRSKKNVVLRESSHPQAGKPSTGRERGRPPHYCVVVQSIRSGRREAGLGRQTCIGEAPPENKKVQKIISKTLCFGLRVSRAATEIKEYLLQ
jgi:hypothetical protein